MMKDHQKTTYLLVAIPVILFLLLGSTSLVADAEGNPVSRSCYTPFGKEDTRAHGAGERILDVQFGRKPILSLDELVRRGVIVD
jgi:hypothetical protein